MVLFFLSACFSVGGLPFCHDTLGAFDLSGANWGLSGFRPLHFSFQRSLHWSQGGILVIRTLPGPDFVTCLYCPLMSIPVFSICSFGHFFMIFLLRYSINLTI